jgi:hypothetical protein
MRSPGQQRSRPTISKIRLIAVTAGHDARSPAEKMPSHAPELNPAEGVWALLKRHLADFAAADRPHAPHPRDRAEAEEDPVPAHLVDGCLPPTGLTMDDDTIRPPDSASST